MASKTGNFVSRVAAGMFAVAAAVMPSQSHSDEVQAQNALYQHDQDTPQLVLAQAKQDTTRCTPCKTDPDDVIYAVNGINGGTILSTTDSKFAETNIANALVNSKMNAIFYITDRANVETPEVKHLLRMAKAMNRDPNVIKAGARIDMVMQVYPERDASGKIKVDTKTGESINNSIIMMFGKNAPSVAQIDRVYYDIKQNSEGEFVKDPKDNLVAFTLIRENRRAQVVLGAYADRVAEKRVAADAPVQTGSAAATVAQKMSFVVDEATTKRGDGSGTGSGSGSTSGGGNAGTNDTTVAIPSIL